MAKKMKNEWKYNNQALRSFKLEWGRAGQLDTTSCRGLRGQPSCGREESWNARRRVIIAVYKGQSTLTLLDRACWPECEARVHSRSDGGGSVVSSTLKAQVIISLEVS